MDLWILLQSYHAPWSLCRHTPAGLCSRYAMVTLPIQWRKRRARRQPRSFPWSEPCVVIQTHRQMIAPLESFRPRKDAHVLLYHVRPPGQTGLRSSSAHWFPELAAGRGADR
jgi:hypothetical protein